MQRMWVNYLSNASIPCDIIQFTNLDVKRYLPSLPITPSISVSCQFSEERVFVGVDYFEVVDAIIKCTVK